jgi:hypothetical protein
MRALGYYDMYPETGIYYLSPSGYCPASTASKDYSYSYYDKYYTSFKCQYQSKSGGALAALVLLVLIIPLVLTFTHCLKRRKENGRWVWKCRKATTQKRCLAKRPRSYEAHLER